MTATRFSTQARQPSISVAIVLLATALCPPSAAAWSDAAESAYKVYKKDGTVAGELILERLAVLVQRSEDCASPLNQMAFNSLTPAHQKELGGGGVIDDFAPVAMVNSIRNIVSMFSGKMTDTQQANFAMEAARGAAIRYRAQYCMTPSSQKVDPIDPAASVAEATGQASQAEKSPHSAPAAPAASAPSAASAASAANPSASQSVVGSSGWDGEVVGKAVEGSKFGKLKVGMTIVEAVAELGLPDDQSFRSTATTTFAWMKFGPDRYRTEYLYKGLGRLNFSSEASPGLGEMRLTRIVNNPDETGKY